MPNEEKPGRVTLAHEERPKTTESLAMREEWPKTTESLATREERPKTTESLATLAARRRELAI